MYITLQVYHVYYVHLGLQAVGKYRYLGKLPGDQVEYPQGVFGRVRSIYYGVLCTVPEYS